jgi:hypothetical protein
MYQNGYRIEQKAIKPPKSLEIYQKFPFQGLPKSTKFGIWFANIPSGNTGWNRIYLTRRNDETG